MNYRTYINEWFQGEVYGEALFGTMADLCTDPALARKLRVLEQLEREMKELLLPAVREAGNPGDENPERIAEGRSDGARLANTPWREVMSGFRAELPAVLMQFQRVQALGPPGKEHLLRQLTAHEQALLDFAIGELEGKPDSLEPVWALLRTSPAAPQRQVAPDYTNIVCTFARRARIDGMIAVSVNTAHSSNASA